MNLRVAASAQRNEIVFRVLAGLAAKLLVMDLKIPHRTTRLAAPTITRQNMLPQLAACLLVKPYGALFRKGRHLLAHEACSCVSSRNRPCCSLGSIR